MNKCLRQKKITMRKKARYYCKRRFHWRFVSEKMNEWVHIRGIKVTEYVLDGGGLIFFVK